MRPVGRPADGRAVVATARGAGRLGDADLAQLSSLLERLAGDLAKITEPTTSPKVSPAWPRWQHFSERSCPARDATARSWPTGPGNTVVDPV